MEWISVKDRLPTKDEVIIAYCPGFKPFSGTYGEGYWYTDEGYDSGTVDPEVTHWMPFPEPPKEVIK